MAKVIDGVFKSFDGSRALVVETSDSFLVAGHRFGKGNFKLISNYFVNGYEPIVVNSKLTDSPLNGGYTWHYINNISLFLGAQVALSFDSSSNNDRDNKYKDASYRLMLYCLPLFLYKSFDFVTRFFPIDKNLDFVVLQYGGNNGYDKGAYAWFSYVRLNYNGNNNIEGFNVERQRYKVSSINDNVASFFAYPLLKNGVALPFCFGSARIDNNDVYLLSLDGDYKTFAKSSDLPVVLNAATYSIPFYEDDSFVYVICDTVAMKQPFLVKLDKSSNKWKMITGYSVGSSVAQQQIISVPSKPEIGNDNAFHWYKFVYDSEQDENGNTVYVPKIVYGTYDKNSDSVSYDDCVVDNFPEDLKIGDDDSIQKNIAIVDLNVISSNNDRYLMVWVYNYQPLNIGAGNGLIPDEKRKCYLFKIDSNDEKNLIYIGEKQLPAKTVWVSSLLSKSLSDYFVVWDIDKVVICKPTFDSNVFEEYVVLPLEDSTEIYGYGFDELKRIVVYAGNGSNRNNYLFVYSDNLPEYIDISFEKDFYDSVPVDTYLTLSVKDYLKEYVSCQVKLRIISNNAVFPDTGNNEIVVDLTTDNQPLNVNLRVEKQGRVIVKVDYVKVT